MRPGLENQSREGTLNQSILMNYKNAAIRRQGVSNEIPTHLAMQPGPSISESMEQKLDVNEPPRSKHQNDPGEKTVRTVKRKRPREQMGNPKSARSARVGETPVKTNNQLPFYIIYMPIYRILN